MLAIFANLPQPVLVVRESLRISGREADLDAAVREKGLFSGQQAHFACAIRKKDHFFA